MLLDNNLTTVSAGVGAGVDAGTEQYSASTPFAYAGNASLDLDGSTMILVGGDSGPVPIGGNAGFGSSAGDVATGGAFTFAAWINPDLDSGQFHFLGKRNRQITGTFSPRWTFSQLDTSLFFHGLEGGAGYATDAGLNPADYSDTENFMLTGGGLLSVGTWTHVALVFGGPGGTQTIYTNGAVAASMAVPAGFSPDGLDSFELLPNNGNNMYLGSRPAGSSGGVEYFDGQMDEVFFAQRALEQSEIQDLFENSMNSPSVLPSSEVLVGDVVGMEFLSENGVRYDLEATTDPAAVAFSATGASVIGDGGTMILNDPTGNPDANVYRIAAQ
jgi:hypothetical protein